MVEVMLEILLFSAYLSAALISVVIAVYAVAVSYLGRETSRSIWSLKKRQMELKKRIKKFEEKPDVAEMEKEIKKYRLEETTLKDKLRFLSLNGAVLLPLSALSLGLFFSLVGIYVYQWHQNISSYIGASLSANAIGIVFLLIVLKTIEWAALRVPLPSFEVFFKSWLKEEKMMTKEKRGMQIWICNHGEIMAEDLDIFVFFPPDFKVPSKEPFYRVIPQGKGAEKPNHNAAVFSLGRVHINIEMLSPEIVVEAPENPDRYKIPVCIYERNTGETEYELLLEVVN